MKRWLKWLILALVLLGLGAGVMRALGARKAQQAALAAAASQREQSVVEIAATDLVPAQERELAQGLPVSGTLRAVNSAVVKARIAGELQGLTVREGDAVREGQVLARIEATESQSRLRQAQEQADAAKAQVDIAQRQFDNNKALVSQGFISQTALDTSLASLNSAIATHKAGLAAVELARKALDDTTLRAPISGWVAQRLAQPGERLAVDTRVIEIVDLSQLELEATFTPADSLAVQTGQRARLQIEQASGQSAQVEARVVRINPSAQAGSRSVVAYLRLDAPGRDGPALRQGLFAQGTLATGQVRAVAVPLSAVRTDKPQPYVQVMDGDQARHQPVQPGARGEVGADTWVAVAGLPAGTRVLVGSVGPLREGSRLRESPPAATSTASAPVAQPAPAR